MTLQPGHFNTVPLYAHPTADVEGLSEIIECLNDAGYKPQVTKLRAIIDRLTGGKK